MKTFLLLVLTLGVFTIICFLQANTFPASENVGIGTDTPEIKLAITSLLLVLK